jgi:hypothetical protein
MKSTKAAMVAVSEKPNSQSDMRALKCLPAPLLLARSQSQASWGPFPAECYHILSSKKAQMRSLMLQQAYLHDGHHRARGTNGEVGGRQLLKDDKPDQHR